MQAAPSPNRPTRSVSSPSSRVARRPIGRAAGTGGDVVPGSV